MVIFVNNMLPPKFWNKPMYNIVMIKETFKMFRYIDSIEGVIILRWMAGGLSTQPQVSTHPIPTLYVYQAWNLLRKIAELLKKNLFLILNYFTLKKIGFLFCHFAWSLVVMAQFPKQNPSLTCCIKRCKATCKNK